MSDYSIITVGRTPIGRARSAWRRPLGNFPRHILAVLLVTPVAVGAAACVGLWWYDSPPSQIHTSSEALIAGGRVAAGPPRAPSLASNCGGADGVTRAVAGPWRAWSLGHLRVRVTLAGCRILDVQANGLATTNPVSRNRSAMAVGQLRGEVLSRQCAGVDVVSGATYTSQAYLHSLQAALDTAHAARPCP